MTLSLKPRATKLLIITACAIALGAFVYSARSAADVYTTSVEAETGTLAGNASLADDGAASAGKLVRFGNQPSASGKISIGSYPGWIRDTVPPESLTGDAVSPYTHIFDFGYFPTSSGGMELADYMEADQPARTVAAIDKAGLKTVLVVGSEGTGAQFAGAAQPQNRAKFIQNMIAMMQQYGHDGLSIDWEEEVPENKENYLALIRETRAELNKLTPRPLLAVDVISGLNPPDYLAQVHAEVDMINMMSYWSDGLDEFTDYTQAGVPAEKLVLGIGMSSDYIDDTVQKVQAKVDLVKQKGMMGTEIWQIGDLQTYQTDPRLQPLRNMIAGN